MESEEIAAMICRLQEYADHQPECWFTMNYFRKSGSIPAIWSVFIESRPGLQTKGDRRVEHSTLHGALTALHGIVFKAKESTRALQS